MTTQTTSFDLDALRDAIERDGIEALAEAITEDVECVQIDARTPPAAPRVLRGREAVRAVLREIASRGLTTRIRDGLVASERAALSVECRYPSGGLAVENALCDLRDGRIARWFGVQAWDEH